MKAFTKIILINSFLFLAACTTPNTNDVSPKQAATMKSEQNAVIIDVREDKEWNEKHIPGAIHIPLGELPKRMAELEPYKNSTVITQCQRGGRSAKAYETLKQAGFSNTYNMAGGLEAWKNDGLAIE